jgi:cytochrome b involved in lipid metabolism
MNSKIVGLIIGIIVLGGLVVNSMLSDRPATLPYQQATTTEIVISTTTDNAQVQPSANVAKPAPAPAPATTPSSTPAPAPQPTVSGYTSAQVALHADRTSCWSSVNGKVYDLTSWIEDHPGGEREILSICGKDGSKAFNNQHGGDRKPEQILASFYLGALIQ